MGQERMGEETTLARESPSHNGCPDDQRNGLGADVEDLVHHALFILVKYCRQITNATPMQYLDRCRRQTANRRSKSQHHQTRHELRL